MKYSSLDCLLELEAFHIALTRCFIESIQEGAFIANKGSHQMRRIGEEM